MKTPPLEKVTFPFKNKTATINKVTRETIKLIPEEQVEELRKLYADDFSLYDYDPYLYKGT